MNIKEKIITEIENLPELMLNDILKQIQKLKAQKIEEKQLNNEVNNYPLKGSVIYYKDPFEPCVSEDDWEVL